MGYLKIIVAGIGLAIASKGMAQTVDGGIYIPQTNNQLTTAEAGAGYQLLWDGSTWNGWKTWQAPAPGSNWAIVEEKGKENGGVKSQNPQANVFEVVSGGTHVWTTDTSFADFDFLIEWQVPANSEENSGLLYHYSEKKSQNNNESAPEYQICNSKWNEWTDSTTTAGADYYIYPLLPTRRARDYSPTWTRAAGHWNQSRIICYKGRVAHYGNSLKLVDYQFFSKDWNYRFQHSKYAAFNYYATWHPGSLFIQDHGQPYPKFRNVRIKKLTENPWGPTSPYLDKVAAARGDTALVDTLRFDMPLFASTTYSAPQFGIVPKAAQVVPDKNGVSVLFMNQGDYSVRVHDMQGALSAERNAHGQERVFLPMANHQPGVLSIWQGKTRVQETVINAR